MLEFWQTTGVFAPLGACTILVSQSYRTAIPCRYYGDTKLTKDSLASQRHAPFPGCSGPNRFNNSDATTATINMRTITLSAISVGI